MRMREIVLCASAKAHARAIVLAGCLLVAGVASASAARSGVGPGAHPAQSGAPCAPGPVGGPDGFQPIDAPCSRYIVVYDTENGAILSAITYVPRPGVPVIEPGGGVGQASMDITDDPLRLDFISWTMFHNALGTWSVDPATQQLVSHP